MEDSVCLAEEFKFILIGPLLDGDSLLPLPMLYPLERSRPARPTHKGWGLRSLSTRAEALHQLFEIMHGFVWSSFSL